MNRVDHQKYIYVHYHLKSLLRQWTQLKPSFEAKLATAYRNFYDTNYLLCLSIWQFSVRIYDAYLKLRRVLNDIYVFCNANQLSSTKLLHTPNMGVSLLTLGKTTLGEVIHLQEKYEAVIPLSPEKFEGDNLSFKNLPYEFQSRLVALLPSYDCVRFKLAGKTATNHVKTRGHFSAFLLVAGNSSSYKKIKSDCSKRPDHDIVSTSFFLKSDSWYVKNAMYLHLDSTEKFDRAVKIVCGNTYYSLKLEGPYTWKHAIYFMNLSKEMEDVVLYDGMLLEVKDFNDFFEAIVQYCKNQKNATSIIIQSLALTSAFNPQFKEYVNNRTTFTVKFVNGYTVIGQQPVN